MLPRCRAAMNAISSPAGAGEDMAQLFIHSPLRMICPVISSRHTLTGFCTVRSHFIVNRTGSMFISRCRTEAAGRVGSTSSQLRICASGLEHGAPPQVGLRTPIRPAMREPGFARLPLNCEIDRKAFEVDRDWLS